MSHWTGLKPLAALCLALACAATTGATTQDAAPPITPAAVPAKAADTINLRQTVTVEVFKKAKDAVVYISTEKIVAQTVSPFPNDPMFRNFGQTVLVPSNSLGSGFVVHESGYVVTNNHVVDRARKISVTLSDERKFNAEVVSTDPDADLAILKIETDAPLPVLPLGDSSDLMIGEPVIAIGNPLGYSYSLSTGVVSAIHREIRPDASKAALSDLIQTDAAINPGNSGGPLLNAYGQVIGINTAVRGDAQNIGFAIQVNRLRDLIPALMDPAKARKLDIPLEFVERRTVAPPADVTTHVDLVTPAGNLPVESINGRKPRDIVDAYAQLLSAGPTGQITVVAGGKTTTATPQAVPIPDAIAQARRRLGLLVEPVSPALAERNGLQIEDGMLVTEVVQRSIGEKAQLQPGDVIFQLGRFRVRTLEEFGQLVAQLPQKGSVRIGVLRGNAVGYGVLQL